MKICFITPEIHQTIFSGGIYCILRHANELVSRGHRVFIVAPPRSQAPNWIDLKAELILPPKTVWRNDLPTTQAAWASISYFMDTIGHRYKGEYYSRAAAHALTPKILPESDITIATHWKTASLVARHGIGKRAYFCQHYESLFHDDKIDQSNAEATYGYGLRIIENSTWLKNKIETRLRTIDSTDLVELAVNAIDTQLFRPAPKKNSAEKAIKIISYGGRDAKWKGFREMALAVKIVRAELPDYDITWNVYGSALLPPNNDIATYNHLGQLNQETLAEAYQKSDILLSASWYESYPLFPIEAMSCGLATITTKIGVEDYAIDRENCIIIEPRNETSAANALIELIQNRQLRHQVAQGGIATATRNTWSVAGDRMEMVIKNIIKEKT